MNPARRDPIMHELKIWPEFFKAVKYGQKPFEVRRHDKDYRVGDTLYLKEWSSESGFTGQVVRRKIIYLMPGGALGVDKAYCVIGMKRVIQREPAVSN